MDIPALDRDSGREVNTEALAPRRRQRLPLAVVLVLALVVPLLGGSLVIGGWAWHRFGSASAALAFLSGEALWIEPSDIDLGPVSLGEDRSVILRASNLTGRTITLNGVPGFCSLTGCFGPVTYQKWPIDIPPRSTRKLVLAIRAPKTRGYPLQLSAPIYTSIGNYEISVVGEVRDTDSSTGR